MRVEHQPMSAAQFNGSIGETDFEALSSEAATEEHGHPVGMN